MKIERLFIYCLLAGTSLLASCSNEDMTDNLVEPLPEGMYPLTFTATQGEMVTSPQTRVSENKDGISSQWDGGEVIKVAVSAGGLGAATELTCTINKNGTVSTDKQLYWQNTQSATINAWYSNIERQGIMTSNTVNLSDQRNRLAYVLKAKTSPKYNTDNGKIALEFKHQLAKVRVKLEKGTTTTDLTNATVKIKNQYISCSIDKGVVKGTGKGTITMYKPTTTDEYYEANIVPGTLAADCFEITAGDKTVSATITAVNATTAGTMYSFTITVDKPGTLRPVNGTFTVNEGDDAIIENYSGTEPIVVNGDAKITISNVKLTTNSNVMTISNRANVTLEVKGMDNIFTSTNGAGIKIMEISNYSGGSSEECGSITINGTDANNSKLQITATSGAAIGFRMYGYYGTNWTTTYCGDITISNITLEVKGGSGSPAIGISSAEDYSYFIDKEFGMITIENSIVNASSTGGAACIGTPKLTNPCPFVLEGISINSSTITATVTDSEYQAACIGFGYTTYNRSGYNHLKKKIKKIEFSNSTLNLTTGYTYKVGFGDGDSSRELTDGIWNNGFKVGDTTWNP